MRVCLEPGCPARVDRGRCKAHAARKEASRHNVDIRRWYRTTRWAALRQQKQVDEPLCYQCEAEGRVEPWTDLDHVVPHRGDPELFWKYSNLRGLCKAHHTAKTARGQ